MVYVYDNNPIIRSENDPDDLLRYEKLRNMVEGDTDCTVTEVHLHPEKLILVRDGKKRTLKYPAELSNEDLWDWLISAMNGTLKGKVTKPTKSPYQAIIEVHRYAADNGGYVEYSKKSNTLISAFKFPGADSRMVQNRTNNVTALCDRCTIFKNAVANLCLKTEGVRVKWAEYERLRELARQNGLL